MDEKYRKRIEAYDLAKQKFWSDEYPKKTLDQKVNFWAGSLHQQMRWNGESGLDEMAVFSKEDYILWKKREPNIDRLLPDIISKLNLNKEGVYKLLELLE